MFLHGNPTFEQIDPQPGDYIELQTRMGRVLEGRVVRVGSWYVSYVCNLPCGHCKRDYRFFRPPHRAVFGDPAWRTWK